MHQSLKDFALIGEYQSLIRDRAFGISLMHEKDRIKIQDLSDQILKIIRNGTGVIGKLSNEHDDLNEEQFAEFLNANKTDIGLSIMRENDK